MKFNVLFVRHSIDEDTDDYYINGVPMPRPFENFEDVEKCKRSS